MLARRSWKYDKWSSKRETFGKEDATQITRPKGSKPSASFGVKAREKQGMGSTNEGCDETLCSVIEGCVVDIFSGSIWRYLSVAHCSHPAEAGLYVKQVVDSVAHRRTKRSGF